MTDAEQLDCLRRTMEVNRTFHDDGYVPVVHISRHMDQYLRQFLADEQLCSKPGVALGAIVPSLLRAPKAMPYGEVLDLIRDARVRLAGKQLHIFGIGGTATLHLAALLDVDSVDSSGWRNRAARGIVQLPGRGDRTVANLGSWRGREPDKDEWKALAECPCPACQSFGIEGLTASRLQGFCNRATHNLWTLLKEARQIKDHLAEGTYAVWYEEHVDNSVYRPLIDYVLAKRGQPGP
jgi:tRNA-guanine family transglycosylase